MLKIWDFSRLIFSNIAGPVLPRRQQVTIEGFTGVDTGDEIRLQIPGMVGELFSGLLAREGIVDGEERSISGVALPGKGAGRFRYYLGLTGTTVSGMVAVTPLGAWKRIHQGTITTEDLGCSIDGATDDSAKITAGLGLSDVNELVLSPGTHAITAPITVSKKRVRGCRDRLSCVLLWTGSANAPYMVKITSDAARIESFSLNGGLLALDGVLFSTSNSAQCREMDVTRVRRDAYSWDTSGNNNQVQLDGCWGRTVGTITAAGTASFLAGSSTFTLTGAPDLTTLNLQKGARLVVVGHDTSILDEDGLPVLINVPIPIDSWTSNTITTGILAVATVAVAACTIRNGNGIHIVRNSDNNIPLIQGCYMTGCAVAALKDEGLYGARVQGCNWEANLIGECIGRYSDGGLTISGSYLGNYYEANTFANVEFELQKDCVRQAALMGASPFETFFTGDRRGMGRSAWLRGGVWYTGLYRQEFVNTASVSLTAPCEAHILAANGFGLVTVSLLGGPYRPSPDDDIGFQQERIHHRVILGEFGGNDIKFVCPTGVKINGVDGATGLQTFGCDYSEYVIEWRDNATGWTIAGRLERRNYDSVNGGTVVNVPNIANGASYTSAGITITGAAMGDWVQVTCSLDIQGLSLTGYVSAADTCRFVLVNNTGGSIDMANATYFVRVVKKFP
jgi:hypothetical protein